MRLTLVDNLLYESSYSVRKDDLQPHLGLMSLAAMVGEGGHQPTIYDPKWEVFQGRVTLDGSLYENVAHNILRTTPQAVGFTALGCNFHCVVKIARHLKHLEPELPILLGGPHATILHEEILTRFAEFDIVVRNEAEHTITPLLAGIDTGDLAGVAGISYRDLRGDIVCNGGSPLIDDLDCLPVPAYDCYPLKQLGLKTIRVEAGRGCPFSCTFCSTASFFGRSYRLKSTPRLLAELDFLHQNYGYTDFKLNHDLFTVNRKKVAEFCEALKARNYTWSCSARVDCVDEQLLTLMRDAGCRNIYFGIETASARMQEISRKRLSVGLVEPTLDVTSALGIETTTSFITGYPEETLEDQDETLDMAGRLFCRPDGRNISQIHLLTPEPGTDLLARYGDRLLFDAHVSEFNFPMLQGDDRSLISDHPILFGNHHYFPSVVTRERHVFITSAWTVVWELGREITAYMLRAFEGRLSRFMAEAWTWHAQSSPQRSNAGADEIQAFLEARFGRGHHLTSLFRYVRAMNAVATKRAAGSRLQGPVSGDPRDNSLRIGPGTIILRDIHHVVQLLETISGTTGNRLLEGSAVGPQGHLLVVSQPADQEQDSSVSSYWIDEVTADLLARFENPKSYWECCKEIADSDDRAQFPKWDDLASLCQMGVLERTSRRASARRETASHP
ncbi:B12-binding domain-containing radical SAM protein [Bradyrhizobium sp.]|jgi:hypothetical protein|uniref:B12-binding domain-containing radical SAM protein n=1 Tax=Bradyrhizobium sp. TaxID=376 RepID=UPI002DF96C61|nr:radical SAM protein [Bradyrhizobium sp.]